MMEIREQKLSNGNTNTYKIINNTAYNINTPEKIVNILENARKNNNRIRIFYGDKETGIDWREEYDTIGTIGRSTGETKIPLLIKSNRSLGGGALLDNCIVKITDHNKRVLYQHENYNLGELEIKDSSKELKEEGYLNSVYCNGDNIANFKDLEKANNYIEFLEGKRNKI